MSKYSNEFKLKVIEVYQKEKNDFILPRCNFSVYNNVRHHIFVKYCETKFTFARLNL